MRLNWSERLFILSPLRALLQERLEARRLFELGGALPGTRVLEIGCGPGFALDLLYRRFRVSRVDAFDLDSRMVALARRRRGGRDRRTRLWVGNVRHIPVDKLSYDAVFNFGAIHHVVDWRSSLDEIHRVLKPGGRFFCEEILRRFITHPIIGRLMAHPQEDRFDASEFIDALKAAGFHIDAWRQTADLYLWVVATKIDRPD